MQSLIAFAALIACVAASLNPLDTPEVSAAKSAHAAAFKAAAAASAPGYAAYPYAAYPYAAPVVTPQGYLADTPEVAYVKVAHSAELAKAGNPVAANAAYPYAAYPYAAYPYAAYPYSAYPYSAYPYSAYHSSYAAPVVTPQGYLTDTPEVAAAKFAHFAEVAKAKAAVY